MSNPYVTIFDLPQDFFESSSCLKKDELGIAPKQASPLIKERDPEKGEGTLGTIKKDEINSTNLTCNVCGIGQAALGFKSANEQKSHFKSDWHRYNLKRYLRGKNYLSEAAFENIIDNEEVSSISGSDTDEDSIYQREEEQQRQEVSFSGAKIIFKANNEVLFGIWKCLLVPDKSEYNPEILEGNLKMNLLNSLQHWAVVLLKGGHFAATCFSALDPGINRKIHKENYTIGVHKTLHRYVIRAKSGQRQAAKDATGKMADSAGATLRRYNEMALKRDIADTLNSWKEHLDKCALVFLSYGIHDAAALFAGDIPPFKKDDPRLRKIPFPIRRPTFSETKRVSTLLTNIAIENMVVKSSNPDEQPNAEVLGENAKSTREANKQDENFIKKKEKTVSEILDPELLKSQENAVIIDNNKIIRNLADIARVKEIFEENESDDLLEEQEIKVVSAVINQKQAQKSSKKKRTKAKSKKKIISDNAFNEALPQDDVDVSKKKIEEGEDEIEKALAEIAKQVSRMNESKKNKNKEVEREMRENESIDERRRRMAEAAERRMASIKKASKSQKLWQD